VRRFVMEKAFDLRCRGPVTNYDRERLRYVYGRNLSACHNNLSTTWRCFAFKSRTKVFPRDTTERYAARGYGKSQTEINK